MAEAGKHMFNVFGVDKTLIYKLRVSGMEIMAPASTAGPSSSRSEPQAPAAFIGGDSGQTDAAEPQALPDNAPPAPHWYDTEGP
eukprot:6716088-Heterocapsa_arctica.AAC.1